MPTSAISAPLRDNAQRFWENQDKVLDSMQMLANAWFERRHTGAHKARQKLGLIAYNGQIEIHRSLLNVVLHEEPHINSRP